MLLVSDVLMITTLFVTFFDLECLLHDYHQDSKLQGLDSSHVVVFTAFVINKYVQLLASLFENNLWP